MSGSARLMRLAPEPTEEYNRLSIRQAENRPALVCTPNIAGDSRRPSPDGLDPWITLAAFRSLQHAAPSETGCAPEES